jgi:hypothetical protein
LLSFDPWQIRLDISYAPAFHPSVVPVTLRNLAFERCSVLFNLAALYSQLAEKEDRQTKERIKKARAYYQVREPPCEGSACQLDIFPCQVHSRNVVLLENLCTTDPCLLPRRRRNSNRSVSSVRPSIRMAHACPGTRMLLAGGRDWSVISLQLFLHAHMIIR